MSRKIYYSGLVQLEKEVSTNLAAFAKHKAEAVELFIDGPQWNDKDEGFEKIKDLLGTYPFDYSVHGPMFDLNLTSESAAVRQTTLNELKKSIEIASKINAKHVIIDPGICLYGIFDKEQAKKRSIEGIKELQRYAIKHQQPIAIENMGYNGTELFTEDEFCHLLDHFSDGDMLGLVLDTGHAHLNGWDIPSVINRTKDHLLAIHLNDNKGVLDNHLAIGDGSINWEPIFKALQNTPDRCRLVLEYNTIMSYHRLQEGKELLEKYI